MFSTSNALLLALLAVNTITLFRGVRLAKYLRSHREQGESIAAFYHIVVAFLALVSPLALLMVEGIVYPQPPAPQPLGLVVFNVAIYTAGTIWAAYGVSVADRLVRKL